MRVSGYLLPFPDPGAADLMSDHLEQEVQAAGPQHRPGPVAPARSWKYSKQQRTAGSCSGALIGFQGLT